MFPESLSLPLGLSMFWRLQRSGLISFIYKFAYYSMLLSPLHWFIWAQLNNSSVHTWGPFSTSRAPEATGWVLQYFPPERPLPAGLLIAAPGPHSLENKTPHGPHHINQLSSLLALFTQTVRVFRGLIGRVILKDGVFFSCWCGSVFLRVERSFFTLRGPLLLQLGWFF